MPREQTPQRPPRNRVYAKTKNLYSSLSSDSDLTNAVDPC